MNTMRIAYVGIYEAMYRYGGVATAIYGLAVLCDQLGWVLDIYADRRIRSRQRMLPKEYYTRFRISEGHDFLESRPIYLSRVFAQNPVNDAGSAYNLLQSFTTKIYDLIIFSDPMIAALTYTYKIHEYIPCYVYLHHHELIEDMNSTMLSKDAVSLYRAICQELSGVGFLTQCESNLQRVKNVMPNIEDVRVMPLVVPWNKGDTEKTGIAYIGGGDKVKNPQLASNVLHKFNLKHPEVPIVVMCGRGVKVVRRLFEDIAEMHFKLSYTAMQKRLDTIKLGIHTSFVEGFGIAVLEQLQRYPVILHEAEYNTAFPTCPTFSDVNQGVDLLESLYYGPTYDKVLTSSQKYIREHYSYGVLQSVLKTLCKKVLPQHSVKAETLEKVLFCLSEGAMPVSALYARLGWTSGIIGMRSLLGCTEAFELIQEQHATYIGLPGCQKSTEYLF